MAYTAPTIHHWAAGDDMNAVRMNEIKAQIDFLRNPPMVHVARTLTNQTLSVSSGWNKITFDSLINSYDPYGMWDAGTPDKITCSIAGWYSVEGQISISNTSGNQGLVELGIYKNGATSGDVQLRSDVQNFFTLGTTLNWSKEVTIFLNVGDWLHLYVWQDADASKTTVSGSIAERSRIRIRWVSN